LTARTPDGTGSGWASATANRIADIDAPAVARVAIDKAVLSQKPRSIEPGLYPVVLEPAAVRDFMQPMLGFGSAFDARAAEEGRSLMTKKGGGTRLGEKAFSEKITIASDPFDTRNPGTLWAFSGVPARKITWVEKGVVKNLTYSRYWAQKKQVEPTPNIGNGLMIHGEDHTIDDLIKSTKRGLLITHFWYIRFLNPQTVQLTGLTRDGVFMIENGKIAYPVMNFRWNESPANSLNKVEMMSREVRAGNYLVPAMKLSEFPVSSLSDAV
jgi:predicted Zn-dependent protease